MTEEATPDTTEGDRGVAVGVVEEGGVGEEAGVFADGDREVATTERVQDEIVPGGIKLRKTGVDGELFDVPGASEGEGGVAGAEFLRSEGDGSTPVVTHGEHEGEFFHPGEESVGGGDELGGEGGLDDV